MKVKVNMLCDVGDKVRIDTETLEFKERIAATPAPVQDQLYIRTPTSLYAFGK